ncbi:MAG: hypothetical protein LBH75_00630 [Treponema sp.]|jgi:hypothetical protein|nr:hypothetical protein [Treponema sp.]
MDNTSCYNNPALAPIKGNVVKYGRLLGRGCGVRADGYNARLIAIAQELQAIVYGSRNMA